jgi:carbamoyltransferase
MLIVGFNAWHGDVAAAIVDEGRLIAALEEERFSRIRHTAGFPVEAIRRCLAMAGAAPRDVDCWAVARGRRVHLLRKAWFALTHRPNAALGRQYRQNSLRHAAAADTIASSFSLPLEDVTARMRYVEHHPAHLASAYFTSGFAEAACAAIDGFGDFVSASTACGRGHRLDVLNRVYFPHSLGLLYLAVTQHLGFRGYGDEYKVMGLAPYGSPRFADRVRRLLRLRPNGGFALALEYFRHWTGEIGMSWLSGAPLVPDVFGARVVDLLGPARAGDEPVTARHEDLAASLQVVFEEAVWHVLAGVHARVAVDALCLAGGCAMNSVANGKVRQRTAFRRVFVQPAAADNGTALGAALHVWYSEGRGSTPWRMTHASWGTEYDPDSIEHAIRASGVASARGCAWSRVEDDDRLCGETADLLAAGAVVGWFQGRMEWGARALGNRSILADPRRPEMRDTINRKIKLRESFRPFAPSILAEALDTFFVGAAPDPFMLQVYPVAPSKRSVIPAVTHVDGSGRPQTVNRESNPLYRKLIAAFAERTGVPVLLNTSFNENEPLVEHPAQAIDCFARTGMDALVLGPHILRKPGQGA